MTKNIVFLADTWKKPYSWQAWPIFWITSEWFGPPRPSRSMTGMEPSEIWTCARFGRSPKGLMKLEGTWLTLDARSDIKTGFAAAIWALCFLYSAPVLWIVLVSWQGESNFIALHSCLCGQFYAHFINYLNCNLQLQLIKL